MHTAAIAVRPTHIRYAQASPPSTPQATSHITAARSRAAREPCPRASCSATGAWRNSVVAFDAQSAQSPRR